VFHLGKEVGIGDVRQSSATDAALAGYCARCDVVWTCWAVHRAR
jgi:hypothetical protein